MEIKMWGRCEKVLGEVWGVRKFWGRYGKGC